LGVWGLLDDLAVVVLAVRWLRSRWPFGGRPRREPAPRWDPYTVLGVRPDATPGEIGEAYREQMKRYHPDRVAGLGEELQRLAHEKTVAIQRAYEELAGRR
jgi:DnaJ-domain-containing protein 1